VKIKKMAQLELHEIIRRSTLTTSAYPTPEEVARAVNRYGYVLTTHVNSMGIQTDMESNVSNLGQVLCSVASDVKNWRRGVCDGATGGSRSELVTRPLADVSGFVSGGQSDIRTNG